MGYCCATLVFLFSLLQVLLFGLLKLVNILIIRVFLDFQCQDVVQLLLVLHQSLEMVKPISPDVNQDIIQKMRQCQYVSQMVPGLLLLHLTVLVSV